VKKKEMRKKNTPFLKIREKNAFFFFHAFSQKNNDYLFNKKRKTFSNELYFLSGSEMDHHECGWRGGSTSDETSI
jgi:hypothetical protein